MNNGETKQRRRNEEHVRRVRPARSAGCGQHDSRANTKPLVTLHLRLHAGRADRERPALPAVGRTRLLRLISVAPMLRCETVFSATSALSASSVSEMFSRGEL